MERDQILLSTTDVKQHLPSLGWRELCELPKVGLHSHSIHTRVRSPTHPNTPNCYLHLLISYKLIMFLHLSANCSRSYLPAQSRAALSRLHRAGHCHGVYHSERFWCEDSTGNMIHMATIYMSTSSNHSKLRSKLTRTKPPIPITAISCQGCYIVPKISTAPSGALTPIHNKLLYQLISPLRTTTGAPNSPCSHKGKVGTISRLGFLCKKI